HLWTRMPQLTLAAMDWINCIIRGHPASHRVLLRKLVSPIDNPNIKLGDIAVALNAHHLRGSCECGLGVSPTTIWKCDFAIYPMWKVDAVLEDFNPAEHVRLDPDSRLADVFLDASNVDLAKLQLIFDVDTGITSALLQAPL
ncbi:hypothetical protein EXIGLDRAFT_722330, partial [Exidia glandulosa HHB12029]